MKKKIFIVVCIAMLLSVGQSHAQNSGGAKHKKAATTEKTGKKKRSSAKKKTKREDGNRGVSRAARNRRPG